MFRYRIPLAILAASAALVAAYSGIACTLSTDLSRITFVTGQPAGGLVGYCIGDNRESLLAPGLLAISVWLLVQKRKRASPD